MIGLVLVTHGRLADEFVAATEHVVGPQEQMRAISIGPDDDMEKRRKDILEAVSAADTGDGVVVLTDMFGGTPSNLAISIMDKARETAFLAKYAGGVGTDVSRIRATGSPIKSLNAQSSGVSPGCFNDRKRAAAA